MSGLKPCPPWHNPLFGLTEQGSYTSSTVVSITGAKRSGKSLLLARLLCYDMLVLKRKVWSTMTVKTPPIMIKEYGEVKSMPINWDTFYMLDKEYGEGTIGLDESIYLDDSRSSLSMKNKLLNTVMNQVGHRNLNVYYTVKAQGWLDRRLQFETDLEIRCEDVARSRWGRANHVMRGDMIRMEFYDKSGFMTGRPYDSRNNHRPFKILVWEHAHECWYSYDTKELVGIEEMFTGVKVDMRQRVISNKNAVSEDIQGALHKLAMGFRSRGNDEIPCDSFWNVAKEQYGIDGDSRQLGRYLAPIGIERKAKRGGNVYNLKNLVD